MTTTSTQKLADHAQIKAWANACEALPARVAVLGETGGAPRFSFADDDGLEPVSWNEFFESFDENDLAVMVAGNAQPHYEIVAR